MEKQSEFYVGKSDDMGKLKSRRPTTKKGMVSNFLFSRTKKYTQQNPSSSFNSEYHEGSSNTYEKKLANKDFNPISVENRDDQVMLSLEQCFHCEDACEKNKLEYSAPHSFIEPSVVPSLEQCLSPFILPSGVFVYHLSLSTNPCYIGSKGMASGDNMSVRKKQEKERLQKADHDGIRPFRRVPVEKPPFMLSQLKKAIPPHCFNRSIPRSFSYVFHDVAIAAVLGYLAITFIPQLPSPLQFLAWPLYWVFQGCVCTGIWVIAHECGHHAFSDYTLLDDIVGLVLHSVLLVPYFSWKYSHRRHHSNTGSLEKDEVFVPKQRSQISSLSKYLNNPPGRIIVIAVQLTLGWPLYLSFNASGRYYNRFACHFDPYGPIYSDRERAQIFISDVGVVSVLYGLYYLGSKSSLGWIVCMYGVPLLIVNAFLVLITYLQHTHPALPHYESSEWDWLRGALATVDRDYGILNKVFHNITDTHVAHHLFSTMPHYHAMEATEAIKPILKDYYQFDDTPFPKALWREARECLFVEPDEDAGSNKGVVWYRNKF